MYRAALRQSGGRSLPLRHGAVCGVSGAPRALSWRGISAARAGRRAGAVAMALRSTGKARGSGSSVTLPEPRSLSGALLVPSPHASGSSPRIAPNSQRGGSARWHTMRQRPRVVNPTVSKRYRGGASRISRLQCSATTRRGHPCDGVSWVVHRTEGDARRLQQRRAATGRWG